MAGGFNEVRSQKSEVNPPLAPPRRGSRGFEQGSKNISPIEAGLGDPIILIMAIEYGFLSLRAMFCRKKNLNKIGSII